MSYIDEKYAIIKDLVTQYKDKEDALKLATSKNTANTTALATKQTVCANDLKDLNNVKATALATGQAHEKLEHLYHEIKMSCANSEKLHKKVLEMVEDAHTTARKTIACAVQFTELGKHIEAQEKKGGTDKVVLLSLIANETATSGAIAEKAVTDANQALKDAIAAAGAVIHLHNSLMKTKELIEEALPLFRMRDKKTGLQDILEELKNKSQNYYDGSHKDQHEAEVELKTSQRDLAKATFQLDVISKKLDAAEKAIALAAAN
jgi:precorrin-6B methylase 2